MVLFYLITGGEFPYFTEIEDWYQHQDTINYDDLWKFSNSFFEMDDSSMEGIQDAINQMIVIEKSMRTSVDMARRKIEIVKYKISQQRPPQAAPVQISRQEQVSHADGSRTIRTLIKR